MALLCKSQVQWRIWTLKLPSWLKCHSGWRSGPPDPINPFCSFYSGEDFSGTYYAKLPKQDGIYIEPGHDFWAATGCFDDILNSGLKTRDCQGQETEGRKKAVWLLPVNNGGMRGRFRKGECSGETAAFLMSKVCLPNGIQTWQNKSPHQRLKKYVECTNFQNWKKKETILFRMKHT